LAPCLLILLLVARSVTVTSPPAPSIYYWAMLLKERVSPGTERTNKELGTYVARDGTGPTLSFHG